MVRVLFQTDKKDNTKVVGRMSDGRLAFLNPNAKSAPVPKPGEEWDCDLVKEESRFCWVRPVRVAVDSEQANEALHGRLEELRKKWPSKKSRA